MILEANVFPSLLKIWLTVNSRFHKTSGNMEASFSFLPLLLGSKLKTSLKCESEENLFDFHKLTREALRLHEGPENPKLLNPTRMILQNKDSKS